jgi:hypothetical protein
LSGGGSPAVTANLLTGLGVDELFSRADSYRALYQLAVALPAQDQLIDRRNGKLDAKKLAA